MDAAINRTLSQCPEFPTARSYLPKLYSPNSFTDPAQLSEIACAAARLSGLTMSLYVNYFVKFWLITGLIGMLSSVLSLMSYSLKEFSLTTFYYYRAINVLDFVYMFSYVIIGARLSPTMMSTSRQWNFVYESWMYVVRLCGKSAHLLVLWLAFDRSVACSTTGPGYNKRFSQKRFVWSVIACIFAFGLVYNAPFTYFEIRVKYFNGTSPETGLAIVSRILTGTEGVLAAIFTTIVLAGLIRMSKRKRKLMENTASTLTSGQNKNVLIDQIKFNQSLCILQLCEGIPYILTMISVYLSYWTNFLMLDRDAASPVVEGGTYESNLAHQRNFAFQVYVRVVVITISDVYSHGFHFFNYLAFSPKFRRTVIGYLKEKKQKMSAAVAPTVQPDA